MPRGCKQAWHHTHTHDAHGFESHPRTTKFVVLHKRVHERFSSNQSQQRASRGSSTISGAPVPPSKFHHNSHGTNHNVACRAPPVQIWDPGVYFAEHATLLVRHASRVQVGCVIRRVQQPSFLAMKLRNLQEQQACAVRSTNWVMEPRLERSPFHANSRSGRNVR